MRERHFWRRVRPYVPDVIAAALSVLGAHLVAIAGYALGSVAGPLFRAIVADRERRESADVVEETIATVVMASNDLMRASVPTGVRDIYGHYPWIEIQALAPALRAGTDTKDWHGATMPTATLSEAHRRWQLLPEQLEEARRHFVRESAGLYLVPRPMARSVNTERARLADAIRVAAECAEIYRRLTTLEMNGGITAHKLRAEAELSLRRDRLGLLLEEIVAADKDVLAIAWREIPERMAELFDKSGRREAARASTFIRDAKDALRETAENAAVLREDAAGVAGTDAVDPSLWLGKSTLRDRLPKVTLADFLDETFVFDVGQEINGWNWVSAQISSARSRFEQLRGDAVEYLAAQPAVVSYRLIEELQETANAAGRVAWAYQMHPDSTDDARRAAVAPLAAFRALGNDVLATIAEIERYAAQ